jgi:hypothetical protein
MMSNNRSSHDAFIKILAVITITFLIGIVSLFGQEKKPNGNVTSFKDGWWNPVLQKHKIDLNKFNFKNTFDMGMNDTINNICLEMGTSDSLNGRNIPFKDAIIISRGAGDTTYWLQTSPLARHDLDNNIIVAMEGKIESFSFKDIDIIPIKSFTFRNLKLDLYKNILIGDIMDDSNK